MEDTGFPLAIIWRMIARSVGPSYSGTGGGANPNVNTPVFARRLLPF